MKSNDGPSMSDAAVKAKTSKDWDAWFATLDREGAKQLDHKAIVRLLVEKYAVPSWWRQMVAVEYERARGLRVRHETAGRFSVAISKTVATGISTLYTAAADAALRKKWFPPGEFKASSVTKDKYLRGSWKGTARLDIGFIARGDSKSQIAVQISNLLASADVESERAAWKTALARLQGSIES